MDSASGRIFSVCMFTVAFVGMFYFFFSDVLLAAVSGPQHVYIHDHFKPEDSSHTASGMVMVPSDCFQIQLRTQETGKNAIELVIDSWQAPYRTCKAEAVARHFSATVFAPKEVQFSTRMDGVSLPTDIVQN